MKLKGPAIVILIVCGVLGGILGAGLGASALDNPWALLALVLLFVFIFVLVIAALASNRKTVMAAPEERAAALSFAPPADRALVYVYRQGFIAKARGAEVAIDGRAVTQLKSPRFTCLTVAPGPHRITTWFAGLGGTEKKPGVAEFVTQAGEVRVFKLELTMGALMNGVIVEEVLAREATPALANIPMVRPDIGAL